MVNELGKKGVTTVLASGNRGLDLDGDIEFAAMLANSPYTVTVNGALMDGAKSDFSCWGQASTDVFAPGTQIMSTVPVSFSTVGLKSGTGITLSTRFFPEASSEASLVSEAPIERFDGASPGVLCFDANPVTNENAKQIGAVSDALGYDDGQSMAIDVTSLNNAEERSVDRGFSSVNGSVYLAVPMKSTADAHWLSVEFAMSDSFKPTGGIVSVVCENADGEPVEIDDAYPRIANTGWHGGAFSNIYQCQWSNVSYNIDGYVESANVAHGQAHDGYIEGVETQAGLPHYPDPGEVTGPYFWRHDGKDYLIAKIGIGEVAGASTDPTSSTKLLIDNVSVGNGDACAGAYTYMPGTSMASPAVAGCVAVVANGEPENASMTDEELELAARERVAKLLAAVEYDDDLATLCRTGGRVNLRGQSTFSKKAPLITRAETSGETLVISGCFFGDAAGTLAIDGTQVAVDSWTDEKIVATLSGFDNGSHVAKVTNTDNAVMQCPFSYRSEQASGRPLYERTHSVPVNLPDYVADKTDRLFNTMVECDGSIYALAAKLKFAMAQSMWRYDTESETWSRCADLPAEIAEPDVSTPCLAAAGGKVYFYFLSDEDYSNCLYCYDKDADSWTKVDAPIPQSSTITSFQDKLLFVGGRIDKALEPDQGDDSSLSAQAEKETKFALLDVDEGTLTKVSGTLPDSIVESECRYAASGSMLYAYMPGLDEGVFGGESEASVTKDRLMRFTYDEASNTMKAEDLTEAFESTKPRYLEEVGQDKGRHFALAGLSDGVAIIGSDELGADTHIILNSGTEATPYARTSSYHHAFDPLAVYVDGYLYVAGHNAAEPDVMYFRSTNYDAPEPQPSPAVDPEPQPSPALAAGTNETAKKPASKTTASGATTAKQAAATGTTGTIARTGDTLPLAPMALCALVALAVAGAALTHRKRARS